MEGARPPLTPPQAPFCPKPMPPALRDLLTKMWNPVPARRPTMAEAEAVLRLIEAAGEEEDDGEAWLSRKGVFVLQEEEAQTSSTAEHEVDGLLN